MATRYLGPMRCVKFDDPSAFRAALEPWLGRDPVRHSLMLGLLNTLVEQPEVYPHTGMWLVEGDGRPVAAALRTPPHNLVLARPDSARALQTLAAELRAWEVEVPGVVGALPEADDFAAAFLADTDRRVVRRMDQALHWLDAVSDIAPAPGRARCAGPGDLDLVLAWTAAFEREGGDRRTWDEAAARRQTEPRLRGEGGAIWLWEDDETVSLAGHRAGEVARVGPVYTPPEHRRRGYATALVAHLSRTLLAQGAKACLLYTDLANPTSNAIYARIGYRRVCDAAMLAFG